MSDVGVVSGVGAGRSSAMARSYVVCGGDETGQSDDAKLSLEGWAMKNKEVQIF